MGELFMPELVRDRQAELRAEAARSRLVALAAGSRPARYQAARYQAAQWRPAVGAVASGVRQWFRRGQLGPVEGACVTC